MTDEEIKAIKMCNLLLNGEITLHILDNDGGTAYAGTVNKTYNNDLQTVLNLIQKQQEELENRDNKVRKIISRLNKDIENITKTKSKKSKHYLDDYTRCRLKAYRTKTKEIKEYIEKQYFERKIKK